ncbi:MAG: hypothetical protein J5802_07680 [Butyrivibrio sp.]|nr:hypothetical protein [Butyrivibrio sp.]
MNYDLGIIITAIMCWEVAAILFAVRSYTFTGIDYKTNRSSLMLFLSGVIFVLGAVGASCYYNIIISYSDSHDEASYGAFGYLLPYIVIFIIFLVYYFHSKNKNRFFDRMNSNEFRNLGVVYDDYGNGRKCTLFRGMKVLFNDRIDLPIFEGGAEIGLEHIEGDFYSCIYFRPYYTRNKWENFKIAWGYILLMLDVIAPFALARIPFVPFGIFSVILLLSCHLCRLFKTFEVRFLVVLVNVLLGLALMYNI